MQVYPHGGYNPQYHHTAAAAADDYFDDDYHYNNAVPRQDHNFNFKDNVHQYYNNGSSKEMNHPPHRRIHQQMDYYSHTDGHGGYDQKSYGFKGHGEDYNAEYPQAWSGKDHKSYGYKGHGEDYSAEYPQAWSGKDHKSHDFKGHGEDYSAEYPQAWNGKVQQQHYNLNGRNGYSGRDKHQQYSGSSMSHDAEMSSGYGVHPGSRVPVNKHSPHYFEQSKPVKPPPVWCPKGIVD